MNDSNDARPFTRVNQKPPTHAVLHFSPQWCMDGLGVEYFDSLAAALDYAKSFEITKGHEKDSLIITEIKASAKAGTNGRFELKN